MGAQTFGWDGADRHVSTAVLNGSTVTYKRDAAGRVIECTETGQPAVRYGYTGPGDSAAFTMSSPDNATIDRHLALIGGVLVTKTGATQSWDYPNIHGDVLVSADAAGNNVGSTRTYDPFGQSLAGTTPNSAGNFDYGWLGQFERGTEHAAGLTPTIEMGARPYVPSMGRFLSVDPVEGGSASDYDYSFGDPVNNFDLNGQCGFPGNPFKKCGPKYSPVHQCFTGNAGQICYQTTGSTVSWGIYVEPEYRGFGKWTVDVYVNGKRFDHKVQYYEPHASIPDLHPGDRVEILAEFLYQDETGVHVLHSVPNEYIVPKP